MTKSKKYASADVKYEQGLSLSESELISTLRDRDSDRQEFNGFAFDSSCFGFLPPGRIIIRRSLISPLTP